MSDGSKTHLYPIGQEVARTFGPLLNNLTPEELAGIFIDAINFEKTPPEDTALIEEQITAYLSTFAGDMRGTAPDWIDMNDFIIVTARFASNPKFWDMIFELSARHHKYLHGELPIPNGQESNYELAHSSENISMNNSFTVMQLATAALYGDTMDNLPIIPDRRRNARLKAALNVSRRFEGIAITPEDFLQRLIIVFRDIGYNTLQEMDAFSVKGDKLDLVKDINGGLELAMVHIHRSCPFEGSASEHLLMGIALAFQDEGFWNAYLNRIRKNK